MHKDELRQLLTDCAAERLAILQRHEASARVVSNYDFNNTCLLYTSDAADD